MIRALDSFEQTSDVVEVDFRPQPQIVWYDLEGRVCALARTLEAGAQRRIRHFLERLAGASAFRAKAG